MSSSASPRAAESGRSGGALFPLDQRFGKTRRVRKRSDFGLLRTDGAKAGSTRHFTWVVRQRSPEDADTETRLGLVVSTRAGNAVVRNRLKRWSRELFRTQREKLPKGIDLLLIYRPQETATTLDELTREWRKAIAFLAAPAKNASFTRMAPSEPGPGAT